MRTQSTQGRRLVGLLSGDGIQHGIRESRNVVKHFSRQHSIACLGNRPKSGESFPQIAAISGGQEKFGFFGVTNE